MVTPFLPYCAATVPPRAAACRQALGRGTLAPMSSVRPPRRHASVSTSPPPHVLLALQALVNAGAVTPGLAVTARGGHLILARTDHLGADPRFRLTPLNPTAYGLSLYRRNRWEPLPYQGSLPELVDVMHTDLAHWAADWP